MKSLHPALDPHPTAKNSQLSGQESCLYSSVSGASLLCHWVEAELSKYNLWLELFSQDNMFDHSISKTTY